MLTKLSFCITCMGRLQHLRQTLPTNLLDNEATPSVEFILVDYSSLDGLGSWVKNEMGTYLKTGRLVYYHADGFRYFRMAHAKNIAHRLAQGEIVCNLDADNFTGPRFAEYLIQTFSNRERLIVRSSVGKGVHGRIALRKIDFEAIGGYDERMEYGWGYEDKDFIRRARKAGIQEQFIPSDSPFLKTVPHGDLERSKHNRYKNMRQSDQCHKMLSEESIKRGEFVANRGIEWGMATIKKNFSETT